MKTYVDFGVCSDCDMPAKRDEDGAWWHVGQSCWAPGVWRPDVRFVTAQEAAQAAGSEQTGGGAPAGQSDGDRAQAAADADRQQTEAPRDRAAKQVRNR